MKNDCHYLLNDKNMPQDGQYKKDIVPALKGLQPRWDRHDTKQTASPNKIQFSKHKYCVFK